MFLPVSLPQAVSDQRLHGQGVHIECFYVVMSSSVLQWYRVPFTLYSCTTVVYGSLYTRFLSYNGTGFPLHSIPVLQWYRVPFTLYSCATMVQGSFNTLFLCYNVIGLPLHSISLLQLHRPHFTLFLYYNGRRLNLHYFCATMV